MKTGEVLDITEDTMRNVEKTTGYLKSITAKIDQGKGTAGKLVNDPGIYQDVNKTLMDTRKGVVSFKDNMEALKGTFLFKGFFKDRGYKDPSEIVAHEISAMPGKNPVKKYIFYTKDVFDNPEKAKLENEKILKSAGEFLEEHSFQQAVIVAYTSVQGEEAKNLNLTGTGDGNQKSFNRQLQNRRRKAQNQRDG